MSSNPWDQRCICGHYEALHLASGDCIGLDDDDHDECECDAFRPVFNLDAPKVRK